MGTISNPFSASEWANFKEAWLSNQGFTHRLILFMKFNGWELVSKSLNPDEQFRKENYATRGAHVWLSNVKVFDTVKGGYFTTGDLDIYSDFRLQGYTAGYTLDNGTVIDEYGGDKIVWNGKVWVVSDQIEPVQFGFQGAQIWWRTVLRRTDRSGPGIGVGP
jgi:hypothetical protein